MCGPSKTEEGLQGSEESFMNTLQQNYAQNFSEQQGVLANLNQTLSPIVAAGPDQTGYSPQELAALNTQAIDTTGANYANAQKALNTANAGRDQGTSGESGVSQQLNEALASQESGQLSNEQLGITESNYATGRSNFQNAVGAEEGVASQFNPVATGGLANNANTTAFGEANTINQQEIAEQNEIASGVSSLALAGATFGAGASGGGGFSGGINALVNPESLMNPGGGGGGGGGSSASFDPESNSYF